MNLTEAIPLCYIKCLVVYYSVYKHNIVSKNHKVTNN